MDGHTHKLWSKYPDADSSVDTYTPYLKGVLERVALRKMSPRFIALSDQGVCIQWNKDVRMVDFAREIERYLILYTAEFGNVWDVCILFNDGTKQVREKQFLRMCFTKDEVDAARPWVSEVWKYYVQLRRIRSELNIVKSKKEVWDTLDRYISAIQSDEKE